MMRYAAILVALAAIAVFMAFNKSTGDAKPSEGMSSTLVAEHPAKENTDGTQREATAIPSFAIEKAAPLPSPRETLYHEVDLVRQESARKLADRSRLISGELTPLELEELFFASTDDIVAASLLANMLASCYTFGPGHRMALEQTCIDVLTIKAEYDKGREPPFHPLFELEKAALAGDMFARYEYWDVLRAALATNTINPMADPDSWIWRRDQAIAWRLYFAQIGVSEAANLLAIDYWDGRLVARNVLYAIVLSQRALDLQGTNSTLQGFIDLARAEFERYGGDEAEIESVYRRLFGR